MTSEQLALFKEAEKKYPIGTKFFCCYSNKKSEVVAFDFWERFPFNHHGSSYWSTEDDEIIAAINKMTGAWIRYNGVWAKIISKPIIIKTKEELINTLFS